MIACKEYVLSASEPPRIFRITGRKTASNSRDVPDEPLVIDLDPIVNFLQRLVGNSNPGSLRMEA